MADNYIEKKFEEHLASRAKQVKRASATLHGKKSECVQLHFPPRRVFVTGGANGIGAAIVAAFRKADCNVAFCDCDSKNGAKTAQHTGARFYPLDVTDSAALDAALVDVATLWGDIDIIVNNVGIFGGKDLWESEIDDFDKVMRTNLYPVYITGRRMAILRKNQNTPNTYGRIINISSTLYLQSETGSESYAASKGGISSLTHALMMSLSQFNVTVNCIAPGWICNDDYDKLSPDEHLQHPSRRVGKPEDIASMCIYLSLPESDFINGQTIAIDGGMTRKMIYPF